MVKCKLCFRVLYNVLRNDRRPGALVCGNIILLLDAFSIML